MVKGISRQVIVVQSPDPQLFEQAIFILKDGQQGVSDDALLKEARRLINSSTATGKYYMYRTSVISAFAGALLTGIVWLATVLF